MSSTTELLLTILSNAFKTFIIYYYLKGFLGFKHFMGPAKRKVWLVILFALMLLFQYLPQYIEFMEIRILSIAIMLFLTSILCNGSWLTKILAIAAFLALSFLADFISGAIVSLFSSMPISNSPSELTSAADFICNTLLLLLVRMVSIVRKSRIAKLSLKFYSSILILPITSILVAYTITKDVVTGNKDTHNLVFLIITLFGLMWANISVFSLFEERLAYANSEQKMEFLNQQLANQSKLYKELETQQITTQKLWHDMNNYLNALNGYLEAQNFVEAKKYIENLDQSIKSLVSIYDTGNSAIDAILNAKYNNAYNKNISFKWKIVIPEEMNIEVMDICLILGNALDNAIEACEKNKNAENKYIYVEMTLKSDYLTICVQNPYENGLNIVGENLQTTKENKLYHGFGLESIRSITKKYKGNMVWDFNDHLFTMNVVLQNLSK